MARAKNIDSPYSAALTGGGFLFEETDKLLPMLLSPERKALIDEEKLYNKCLMINSESSRKRFISEIERRFDNMAYKFWEDYMEMSEEDRRIALLYVILKTYRIAFDLHIDVTKKKWNSVQKQIELADLLIAFNDISAKDEFVDSWSDLTKRKVASAYLTILRRAGMLDEEGNLRPLNPSNPEYYLDLVGEPWFLEACLWAPYQIENLKKQTI